MSLVRARDVLSNWLGGTLLLLAAFVPASAITAQSLVINELAASNQRGLRDENGDASDWIELHNTSNIAIQLTGWGLSDTLKQPLKWRFEGGEIPSGGFFTVFASGKNRQPHSRTALTPSSVAGLRLWLKAESIDTNDTQQVRKTATGWMVRRWNDTSGTSNDAIASGPAFEPLLVPAAEGRAAALRFDGNNDLLTLGFTPLVDNFSIVVVVRATRSHENDPEGPGGVGGVQGQRYLFGARHGGDLNAGAGISMGTNGIGVFEHGSGYMPSVLAYPGDLGTQFHILTLQYADRKPSLYIDGLLAREGQTSPRLQVTSPIEIGSGAYGSFAGEIAEILTFDRPLPPAERQGIEKHLADRHHTPLPAPFHTSFQLASTGETVVLTSPAGQPVDRVDFGPQYRDVTVGRQPDGTGPWLYFSTPTPGASNTFPGAVEFLEPPLFSAASGFYTTNFDLTLSHPNPGAEIRYTLDGSEPTTSSTLYASPLILRSRTGSANQFANIPTVPGGPVASGSVFKGWVVRARAFKPQALPSELVTRTFWIDPKGRSRYTVPVVSLATDRRHFFSADTGIYVPGNNGNYNQRGPEWERPVHLELCELDNSVPVSQPVGAKIHGNTSQNFPIKGLDLDSTGVYGTKSFRYRFFPDRDRDRFEHILLRPTGHDQQMTFMRDEFMQRLGSQTGAESQAARLCVVFVNGEYWGLHYLKEKEDAEFVSHYSGYADDELDYLEGYASAKAGDTKQYQALLDLVASTSPVSDAAYAEIQQRMDVANYIDYKACEIFFYRWDIGNHRLWRPRTPEGRWRWLQFDNDVGWGGFWAEQPAWAYDMLDAVLSPDGRLHGHNNEVTTQLLRTLVTHPEFRRDFINRTADLINTVLMDTNTSAAIADFAQQLEPEMAEHIRRWRAPDSITAWKALVATSHTYAQRRPKAVREHLMKQFALGDPVEIRVSLSDAAAGVVQLNTLVRRDPAAQPFTGTYFSNHPLPLEARANPGYRFVRWEGLGADTAPRVLLHPTQSISLQAVFERLPSVPLEIQLQISANPPARHLRLRGNPGQPLQVQTSTDLLRWSEVGTTTLGPDGTGQWPLPEADGMNPLFLRARE